MAARDTEEIQRRIFDSQGRPGIFEDGNYLIDAMPGGTFDLAWNNILLQGESRKTKFHIAGGCGPASRVFNVPSGFAQAPRIRDLSLVGPVNFGPSDDISGIALGGFNGPGVFARNVAFRRLHVGYRGYAYHYQRAKFRGCLFDAEYIGAELGKEMPGGHIGAGQSSVFSILTMQRGEVILQGCKFLRGGSVVKDGNGDGGPNKNHDLYLGYETSLWSDGCVHDFHLDGRSIQVYDGDMGGDLGIPRLSPGGKAPDFWRVQNGCFNRQTVENVHLQTNPFRKSVIEQTTFDSAYCCIEARGPVVGDHVTVKGGVGVSVFPNAHLDLDGCDLRMATYPIERARPDQVRATGCLGWPR